MHLDHAVSRRRFLAGTAAAAAGAALFDLPGLARASEEDPYGGFPMGIQSYTLRKFSMQEAVRHTQALGLHFIEFFGAHFPTNSSPEKIREMKDLLGRAQLKISAHGVNNFSKNHEANRRLFQFAKAAGIRNISANPQPDSFDSLEKLVEEFDIRIAIHNHGPGALYDGLESVTKAVSGRHKHIGACVDTGHVLRSGQDPVKWIRELGPRVFGVHIKDVAEQQARTHDVVIGTGHLDVAGMFRALRQVKFPADGSMSIEYEANPDNPIDDVTECLAVARKAIAQVAG